MTMAVRLGLLVVVLGLALGGAMAAPAPARNLPADTVGFLSVPSWETATAASRQNALGRLWADPAMRSFREGFEAGFRKEIVEPLADELGLDIAALIRLLAGPVTLAFGATPPDNQPGRSTAFLFMADTGTNTVQLKASLILMRKKWADAGRPIKSVHIRNQEFAVVTLSVSEITRLIYKVLPDPDAMRAPAALPQPPKPVMGEWTIGQAGALLLVSDSSREIEKALALQTTNPPPALADSPVFVGDAIRFDGAQAIAWINVKAAMSWFKPEPPPMASDGTNQPTGALSLVQMLKALGFDGLHTASFAIAESGAGTSMTLRLRVPESDRRGLFQLLKLETKDSGPLAFVPADVVRFRRARLDLAKTWGHFETTLAEASPAAASILKFIINTAGKDKDPQYDLRERLLPRLGDDLLSCETATRRDAARPATAPRSLFLVGARNPDQVVASLRTLPTLLPPETTRLKEREFLGRTIYSVTLPRKQDDGSITVGPAWHYTSGGSHVALSSDASLIEDYLRGSDSVRRTLREKPGLAEAAQKAAGFATGYFSYENTSESARLFFEAARRDAFDGAFISRALRLGNQFGLGQAGGMLSWCDFFALPRYEQVAQYFHFHVATLGLDGEGLTFRFFAPRPPTLPR